VAKTVDLLLRGVEPRPEIRERSAAGEIKVVQESDLDELHFGETREVNVNSASFLAKSSVPKVMRVFPYAVSRNRLEKAIAEAGVPLRLTNDLSQADLVLTIKGQYRKMPKRLREAEARGKPVYVLRSNTKAQMQEFVTNLANDEEAQALMEAEQAVHQVQLFSQPVELSPQNAYIRRLQHQLIEKFKLQSTSVGDEPDRRVKVLPVDLSSEIR
jgi:hypothetical protein